MGRMRMARMKDRKWIKLRKRKMKHLMKKSSKKNLISMQSNDKHSNIDILKLFWLYFYLTQRQTI